MGKGILGEWAVGPCVPHYLGSSRGQFMPVVWFVYTVYCSYCNQGPSKSTWFWGGPKQTRLSQPLATDKIQRQIDKWWNKKGLHFGEANTRKTANWCLKDYPKCWKYFWVYVRKMWDKGTWECAAGQYSSGWSLPLGQSCRVLLVSGQFLLLEGVV